MTTATATISGGYDGRRDQQHKSVEAVDGRSGVDLVTIAAIVAIKVAIGVLDSGDEPLGRAAEPYATRA